MVYMIHTSFHSPGRENYTLRPGKPVALRGLPDRVSLWLHGDSTLHSLELLFRDASGHEIPVYAGKLEHNGWKRFEVRLPEQLRKFPERLNEGAQKQFFTGIRIVSHPSEKAGDTAILVDNILLMTRPYPLDYPGMSIPDNW